MRRLEIVIAFVALFISLIVGWIIYGIMGETNTVQAIVKCPPLPVVKSILVAQKDIPIGENVIDSMTTEKWPESMLRSDYFEDTMANRERLKTFISRRIINSGEPLRQSSIVDRKTGSVLAALLKDGMRAFSLNVEQGGISALLNPGDYVDVMVTLNNPKEGETSNKTILCSVKVLAVDNRFSPLSENVSKQNANTFVPPKMITLVVSPQQASTLATATRVGVLSVSLHSVRDKSHTCNESDLKPVESIKIIRGDGVK